MRADSVRVAYPLFHEGGGGSSPTSALQLWFGCIDVKTSITLNRLWHSRLPNLVEGNLTRCTHTGCYVASFEGVYYAVAIWTSPVANKLPQATWLELRRFAIAPDAPKNTASRMLGWMVRDLKARLPMVERLISYQDCDVHQGTIYRAAGWSPVQTVKGCSWNSKKRKRSGEHIVHKVRWEKVIREEVAAETPPFYRPKQSAPPGLFSDMEVDP